MIELVTTRDIEPYFPAIEKIELRKLIFFKSKTFFDQNLILFSIRPYQRDLQITEKGSFSLIKADFFGI